MLPFWYQNLNFLMNGRIIFDTKRNTVIDIFSILTYWYGTIIYSYVAKDCNLIYVGVSRIHFLIQGFSGNCYIGLNGKYFVLSTHYRINLQCFKQKVGITVAVLCINYFFLSLAV